MFSKFKVVNQPASLLMRHVDDQWVESNVDMDDSSLAGLIRDRKSSNLTTEREKYR